MKSNYTSTHPLMKMSGSVGMTSSRPHHETVKSHVVVATTIPGTKQAGEKSSKK